MGETYGDMHRYFIQFLMKNSCISPNKALEFCRKFKDENSYQLDDLKTLISEINERMSKHELKIVFVKCEVTGVDKVVLLNTANDEINKLQNVFSPVEIEYFQSLLKEILIDDNHSLSNIACFNLSDSLTGTLRKDNVEQLLKKWVCAGYLVEKDSRIYLGARCIAEFAPFFHAHFKDYYSFCHLCSEPVFSGKMCSSCNKLMHKHCIEKYLEKQKNKKCPHCKSAWSEGFRDPDVSINGQDSSSESEDESNSNRGPSQRKNPRLSKK